MKRVKFQKYDKKRNARRRYLVYVLLIVASLGYRAWSTPNLAKIHEEMKSGGAIETKVENIYIFPKENGYSLKIIKNDGNLKIIEDIEAIGEVSLKKPILIYKDGKAGYIDSKGEEVISPKYEGATEFKDGIAGIKLKKFGVINEKGKYILKPVYDEIYLGSKKRIIAKYETEYFLISRKKAKKLNIDSLYQLNDEKIVFEKNNLLGIMDFDGNTIIKNKYDEISNNVDKTIIVCLNGKYSILNISGKEIAIGFDYIEQLDKNTYRAGTDEKGRYAFISEKVSTDEVYEYIEKDKKSSNYIGMKGKVVDIIDEKLGVLKSLTKEEYEKISR